ncbi:Ig-like domain-containing protein [Inconstantimicrobium mannanitabidum]|uniref:Uncharacterized protein n=1 Tax=Inconstantimicrobium mannanitabidum TaxID=1604901 RepID=A0ACB5REB8_9CLOT|nr:Ig-like domain-containing protein [Clostridium sp. TW13]GKX67628.1 hypothetical protein rsdtw13_28860 [Clostridium sp. TW13]
MYKKIISFFVVFFLVASNVISVKANSDVTPPVVTGMKWSATQLKVGERLDIEVDAQDTESGINTGDAYTAVYIKHSISNVSKAALLFYDVTSKKLKGSITITSDMASGEWVFDFISVKDKANNEKYYYQHDFPQTYKVNIIGGTSDVTPPVVTGMRWSATQLKVGERLDIEVDAQDTESGINTGDAYTAVYIKHSISNVSKAALLFYDVTSKKLKGSITITSDMASGEWVFDFISVKDKANNKKYYYQSNFAQIYKVNIIDLVNVQSVSLNITTDTLIVGRTDTLKATVNPSNATNKAVKWTTSNASVVQVDQNGNIKALAKGTAIITVTTVDGNKTASCTVNVTIPVVNVQSVNLNKTADSLKVGATDSLVATVLPSNATNKSVTWKSSNTAIAKVDANGKVTAVGAGTAVITATTVDGNKTASCTVNVTIPVINVQSVNLNKTADSLKVGATDSLVATVLPSNATNKSVTWKSSNTTIAKVDVNGKVTAVGAGIAVITATTVDGNKTASCTVNVTIPVINVQSVSLNKTTDTLIVGRTDTLKATINPSNATNSAVKWSSSNAKVVTVDQNGNIKAVAKGTAVITATTVDGQKVAKCNVTVNDPIVNVVSVSLNKTADTLIVGRTDTLKATINPSNATNSAVKWTSSNTKVVTVDQNGNIKAVGKGTAVITVTTVDGQKVAKCNVTVNNPINVVSVSLNKTTDTLIVGRTDTLKATINQSNATNKAVKWTSSNTKVVTVDQNGNIKAVGKGTAVITVTTVDGQKVAKCNVTVNNPINVVSVSLNKTTDTLIVGRTDTLKATINPSNATNKAVKWTSSNSKVVTVDQNGNIKAVAKGTAIITVTTVDGQKVAKCTVIVTR